MDAISQLQEQVNKIATISFTTIGTLERDDPPVRISPNYPDFESAPPTNPNPNPTDDATYFAMPPKLMSADLVKAAKQVSTFNQLDLGDMQFLFFSLLE
ncbi:putative mediator complex, subunit Med21 [Rosa chinensis]|uniref:Mediator of RNA polymerase II transcription subunit 21 n=1 Tax=Rosa chinensis TaxID=74649 RepID=A0A2P6QZG2_ROSCH|nr:putative mediator complex, subunit Med21 [Rosa chinensis]